MDKYTGKKLDGRYEIRELIGVGGMAYVYHCYDAIDAREVAIKILKDEFLDNEDFIRRFKNESKAIAVLNHPNIVRVYDVSFGDMIQYIVMEYIDGITLKEYIEMRKILDWKEAVHLTTQILKALQHAHENGIVHRDIKPQNIMLLQDGTIKVTDFGIARFSTTGTGTMSEQAIGSVHYIAPEQARGDKTDGKTDIYSVGVMMYEMLTGRLPFDADSAVSVALMQLQSTPKRLKEVNDEIPEGLEEITLKAMRKNPNDRYHSAVEMLSDIERFRLNPSIKFEYKYFDDKPKYSDAIKSQKLKKEDVLDRKYSDEDFQYDDAPVKSPALSAIKGVIIAALIALVAFGGYALIKAYTSSLPKEVDIPNFVGMSIKEAASKNIHHFNFEYDNRYTDQYAPDTVISQEPEAGSKKVLEGSSTTITLIVNSSDTTSVVPYLNTAIGTEGIVAKIEAAHLNPQIIYVESLQSAQKVDSVYPPVGTKLKVGSNVYVFVSKGITKETGVLPEIQGLDAEDAIETLDDLGFTNINVSYDDTSTALKDEVVTQNPVMGSVVPLDYEITLVVSKGEAKEKKATLHVDLPNNVTDEVDVTVYVDGVRNDEYSQTLIPAYAPNYTIQLKIKNNTTVVILLNDQNYREYYIDYDNGTISTVNAYNFTYKNQTSTEAPVVTEAVPEEQNQ